jgi:hypothetical protein
MKFCFSIALACLCFVNCDSKLPENTLLIGAYRGLDKLIPYPYLLHQKNDSVSLFDNQGMLIERIKNSSINGKTVLKFKSKQLKFSRLNDHIFTVFDILDTVNFRGFKSRAQFETIALEPKFNIQTIKNFISESVFKYQVIEDENSNPNSDFDIEQLLYFKNDSVCTLTNYYYQGQKTASEYETKAYIIFSIDQAAFLSFRKEDNNPQSIFQITNLDSLNIELKDFSSREPKTIQFNNSSVTIDDYLELIKNTAHYSNCFDGYQGEYYYGEDVTYIKGNQYIIDIVSKDAPKTDVKSGYIILHYTLNCGGELGRFGLIQMSREFKSMTFSKEIVSHIVDSVRDLKDWPTNFDILEGLVYKDVHGFLMFKIENGIITDLCP